MVRLRPGSREGQHVQVPHRLAVRGLCRGQGRPLRPDARGAAEDRFRRLGPRLLVGRRGLDDGTGGAPVCEVPPVDLRGPPRILAEDGARGFPVAHVPRDRAASGRLRPRDGLHARRDHARHGAPLLRLVGIPGDGLLRAHQPVRHAAGLHVPRRHAPQGGHRGHPRLGAGALSLRRARPRILRRHLPLRARQPDAADPSGVGEPHLQLRARRGAQLPVVLGPLLARSLPRRRSARGRRRVDAPPRLRPGARRVGAQRIRRAREPRRDHVPPRHERRDRTGLSRRADDRGGVHLLAHGLAPDLRGRPRLRDEVGPRVDARHARVPGARSHLPPVSPREADVPPDVRIFGRTSSCRSRTTRSCT